MVRFLKGLFNKYRPNKSLPEPSLREAYLRAKALAEEHNELCFFISQIKDFEAPKETIHYMEKGDYNLLSLRDELKIHHDRKIIYERFKRSQQDHRDSEGRDHQSRGRPPSSSSVAVPRTRKSLSERKQ